MKLDNRFNWLECSRLVELQIIEILAFFAIF